MSDDALDPIWKALSDPTRRRILDLLNDQPRTTGDLATKFNVTRFAVMKHLTVLEEVGLISVQRKGRERWNHIEAAPLARIYDRWVSKHAAWSPTLEGEAVTAAPEVVDAVPEEPLQEIYVVVRPEEKYAVERAMQSIIPPVYTCMHATGRGGYWEPATSKKRRWTWRKRQERTAFLPKVIFTVLVPESHVTALLRAVSSALRLEGGPDESGTGFAAVMAAEREIVVGAGAQNDPANRVAAEGWS